MGIRVQKGTSRVTQPVSYLGYPGLPERKNFMDRDSLAPYLVVLLVAVSYSRQYVYTRQMSFKKDTLAIQSLMPSTYTAGT